MMKLKMSVASVERGIVECCESAEGCRSTCPPTSLLTCDLVDMLLSKDTPRSRSASADAICTGPTARSSGGNRCPQGHDVVERSTWILSLRRWAENGSFRSIYCSYLLNAITKLATEWRRVVWTTAAQTSPRCCHLANWTTHLWST